MRVCGVGEPLALVMYGGVYWGGPRWTETARTNVEHLLRSMQSSAEGGRRFHSPMDGVSHKPFDNSDLTQLQTALAHKEMSFQDIDFYVDAQIQQSEASGS